MTDNIIVINDLIECDDCEDLFNSKDGDDLTTATGNRVCGDCADNYNSCKDCGEIYPNEVITLIDDSTYCESCRDDNYTYCGECGEINPNEVITLIDDSTYCESCRDDNYTYCDDCYTYIDSGLVEYIQGINCCEDCRINRFTWCDDCDGWFDDNIYSTCPDCVTGLYDNDYTPELIFHGSKTKLYLGMELEATPNNSSERPTLIDLTYELFGRELVYLKRDGSVSTGFEIVTHPINAKEFKDVFNIDKLKTLADAGLRSWDSQSSCGIHIHFSKIAFENSLHIYAFSALVFNNPEFMQQLAGRESRYASFDDNESTRLGNKKMSLQYAKGCKNYNRYLALNNQNSETIELRIFKGSLNTERVKCIIDFCNLLFDYTQTITVKKLLNKELTTDNMIEFCRSHSFNYSNLINHHLFKEGGN